MLTKPTNATRPARRAALALACAAATTFGTALTGCTAPDGDATADATSATEEATPPANDDEATENTDANTSPSPTPEPEPSPDGTYTSSCDYVLGDFTEGSDTGFRFIADAQLENTGNVGTVTRVVAEWYLSGGDSVKETKTVKMKSGASKRVGMTVPATSDQIDRHQALGFDAETCKVTATMVKTFGAPKQ